MILHCMKKASWDKVKDKAYYEPGSLALEGFIHCSQPKYLWRVVPNFLEEKEALVLLCINEYKLEAELRFEDGDGCGRSYPHIYGPLNLSAVCGTLPFLTDESGQWIKNQELEQYRDE